MKLLALDIGMRRTGVAFLDTEMGIPLPLDTIRHTSAEELLPLIQKITLERNIEKLIIGLPLLPSGVEGEQATIVRSIGTQLEKLGIPTEYKDERYSTPQFTSPKSFKHSPPPSSFDGDAAAACSLLTTVLGTEK